MPSEIQGILVPPTDGRWSLLTNEPPTFEFSADGSKATMTLKTLGFDYARLITEQAIGGPYLAEDGTLQRNLPQTHWAWFQPNTFKPFLFVVGAAVEPLARPNGQSPGSQMPWEDYDSWKVKLFFSSLPFDVRFLSEIANEPKEAFRWTRWTRSPATEMVGSQAGTWVYDDGSDLPASNSIGTPKPCIRLHGEWFEVIDGAYNPARLASFAHQSNDSDFLGNPADTVLYGGATLTPTMTALGLRAYKIDFHFMIYPFGVNTYVKPDVAGPKFVKLKLKGDTNTPPKRPVAPVNLSDLFRP
jgi:hypothetical protein